VAFLYAKFQLPVLLVPVCRNRPTAKWAAGPFECRIGPWATQVTRPFVLGPDVRHPVGCSEPPCVFNLVARGFALFPTAVGGLT